MKNENYVEMYSEALKGEGKLLKGYSLFHNYSFFNQMWIMHQMMIRGIDFAPVATFKKWTELGRTVRKGEKALEMCVPAKWKNKETDEEGMYFTFAKKWFAMTQTDGEEATFPEVDFDFDKMLEVLGITKQAFSHTNGNAQGYAMKGNIIAINPLAELPAKTCIHEVAHILLHLDGDQEFSDDENTPTNIKEIEAESVALCVSLALGLEENIKYCVGYINNWRKNNEVPVDSIKRIFKATDKILKAGKVEPVAV